jgi:sphingolipid 4-desaturase/C4-monooxygenase
VPSTSLLSTWFDRSVRTKTITIATMASRTSTTTATKSKKATEKSSTAPLPEDVGDGGNSQFFWTYTEEPHRSRRQLIIKAHPEITKLCGPEPLTKWLVLAVVSLQIGTAYLLRDTHPLDWKFLVAAYVIGATANQNLFLAIHEISHNLAFKSPMLNRLGAVFANLPIGIPYSASFRVSLFSSL